MKTFFIVFLFVSLPALADNWPPASLEPSEVNYLQEVHPEIFQRIRENTSQRDLIRASLSQNEKNNLDFQLRDATRINYRNYPKDQSAEWVEEIFKKGGVADDYFPLTFIGNLIKDAYSAWQENKLEAYLKILSSFYEYTDIIQLEANKPVKDFAGTLTSVQNLLVSLTFPWGFEYGSAGRVQKYVGQVAPIFLVYERYGLAPSAMFRMIDLDIEEMGKQKKRSSRDQESIQAAIDKLQNLKSILKDNWKLN